MFDFSNPLPQGGMLSFADYVFGQPNAQQNDNTFGVGGPVKEAILLQGTNSNVSVNLQGIVNDLSQL